MYQGFLTSYVHNGNLKDIQKVHIGCFLILLSTLEKTATRHCTNIDREDNFFSFLLWIPYSTIPQLPEDIVLHT